MNFVSIGSLEDWINRRNKEFFVSELQINARYPVREDDSIKRGLTKDEIVSFLTRFIPVCYAIQDFHHQGTHPPLGEINHQGIIHRDIKTRNTLCDDQFFVVSDFGLARFTRDDDVMVIAYPERTLSGSESRKVEKSRILSDVGNIVSHGFSLLPDLAIYLPVLIQLNACKFQKAILRPILLILRPFFLPLFQTLNTA